MGKAGMLGSNPKETRARLRDTLKPGFCVTFGKKNVCILHKLGACYLLRISRETHASKGGIQQRRQVVLEARFSRSGRLPAHRLHPHHVRTYSKLQTERQQFIGTVPNNECPSGQSCAIWCGQSEFTWKCLSLEGKTISREDIVCSSVLLLWSALERFKKQHLFSTPSFSSSTPSLRYKSILNTYLVMTAAQRESAPALEPSFDNLLRSNGVDEDIIMAFRVRGVLDRELIVCSFRFNRRGGS